MDKSALRRAISAKKEALTPEEIERMSENLAKMLFSTAQYREAKTLYAYLSFNQEVRTRPIIERAWADGKQVAVPRVFGRDMRFFLLNGFDEVAEGYRGIPEPKDDAPVANDERALVLLPGLAFDREGRRVGYGGGFYDRYLSVHRQHALVALCYDFQLFDQLDTDPHDVPAQLVLSTNS